MLANFTLLLRIAGRNLWRNRGRSLITGAAIAAGVALCIASFGIMDGMSSDMVRSITDTNLGHVQIHAPDFSARPKLSLAFDQARVRTELAAHTVGVEAVSARVIGWVLAETPRQSASVELVGVDPIREAAVTQLDRHVRRGRYLPSAATPWPEPKALNADDRALDARLTQEQAKLAEAEIAALDGAALTPPQASGHEAAAETRALLERLAPDPSAPPPLLLGDRLAKRLHAEPGAKIRLRAQDLDGNPTSAAFRVVGVVHTGNAAFDANRAIAHIADVRHFFSLGDRAHELTLRLRVPSEAPRVVRALEGAALNRGLSVKTWQELRPDVVSMVQMNSGFTAMLVTIIFAIAAIGVADTILMAVFERRRELGVLKAVGMRPLAIVVLIESEAVLLGLGASIVGMALGLGIDALLGRFGIPLGGLSGFSLAGAAIPPVLHASVTVQGVFLPAVAMLAMSLLASLWPALIAAGTEPVLAMRER